MTNDKISKNRKYDLEERTAEFGENIIKFAKKVPKNEITRPLITQLVKAGTSIGANYCEADDAESGKDFKHKIGIAKKEPAACLPPASLLRIGCLVLRIRNVRMSLFCK